ncbi:Transcriptional regulator, AbiEi antitoxin, Type IV TA system [Nocardioides terrae]|uniref:Transcriptional regulator, AbiEi antitoxin, Type IV TA system n=1 Tax=Nocardioides terrae TaxID=574651 RepID=A0A1I1D832_9ACTN|nr:hypothetical protein [Nocardioides terrae]SFB71075.1 Transcriptional regulator, AbiEi antitoxin, Type IV TA system [Nocardioides terrae]
MDDIDPRQTLVSARARRLEGSEPPHLDGSLDRVRRGYYRPAGPPLTPSQLYRLRIYATSEARTETLVFSHASAAELWGCPQLNADTKLVHTTRPGKARRTAAGVATHRARIPDEHVVQLPDGLLVTSREWTAVQVAAALVLPNSLLPLDHLIRLLNEDPDGDPGGVAVVERLVALIPPRMKGGARAERNLRLADARSGSAGESLSRGQMEILQVPRPQLQTRFPRVDQPGDDVVDFDWPELESFGEFDGQGKYFDSALTDGRTPQQVLWDEKLREDRIRRHRPHVARWGWHIAMSRERLGKVLALAGVRPGTRAKGSP